jgi:hypothetical protein
MPANRNFGLELSYLPGFFEARPRFGTNPFHISANSSCDIPMIIHARKNLNVFWASLNALIIFGLSPFAMNIFICDFVFYKVT